MFKERLNVIEKNRKHYYVIAITVSQCGYNQRKINSTRGVGDEDDIDNLF